VARQIRQQNNRKRPLIVAVSGYGDKAAKDRSYEAGIDLHFVKPVEPAELEDLLKRYQGIAGLSIA
jgi:CheY-like chemotaxis protein